MPEGSGRVFERLVRESGQDPELVEVVRSILYARRRLYATMLNRAIARGELPPEVDDELLPDLLLGPLWFRILVTGAPVAPEDARSVVRVVSTASHPARRAVRPVRRETAMRRGGRSADRSAPDTPEPRRRSSAYFVTAAPRVTGRPSSARCPASPCALEGVGRCKEA